VVRRLQLITERMKETEQIAFAATQGLYDRETGEFVSEAEPQPEFASQLLHQSLYLGPACRSGAGRRRTGAQVDQRTANELEHGLGSPA
jgi:two-component system, sensor histidine kinase and response regulator